MEVLNISEILPIPECGLAQTGELFDEYWTTIADCGYSLNRTIDPQIDIVSIIYKIRQSGQICLTLMSKYDASYNEPRFTINLQEFGNIMALLYINQIQEEWLLEKI